MNKYTFVLAMYLQANQVNKALEKGPDVQSSLLIDQLLKQETTNLFPPT